MAGHDLEPEEKYQKISLRGQYVRHRPNWPTNPHLLTPLCPGTVNWAFSRALWSELELSPGNYRAGNSREIGFGKFPVSREFFFGIPGNAIFNIYIKIVSYFVIFGKILRFCQKITKKPFFFNGFLGFFGYL